MSQISEVVIQCADGEFRATPIRLWTREENIERTAADTIRNVVAALFEANAQISRIGMVLTRGAIPLLICEVAHRWFHVGASPALKEIAIRALRPGSVANYG